MSRSQGHQDLRLPQTRHRLDEHGQGEILQVLAVVHFTKENNVETWSISKEVLDGIMTLWLKTLQQHVDVGLLQRLFALHLCNCSHFRVVFFPQNHKQIYCLQLAELVDEMRHLWIFFLVLVDDTFKELQTSNHIVAPWFINALHYHTALTP